MVTEQDIFQVLQEVKDPEIPVVSVVELGIVRAVSCSKEGVEITVTPTYSGCPATHLINDSIREALAARGIQPVTVTTVLSPPWTTDWITADGREKMRAYGIAPPGSCGAESLVPFPSQKVRIVCPYCASEATRRTSEFGATACKSYYFCDGCSQPFEYFKPI